jgi:lipopolysaccharide transport system ATP-binding protein
MSSRIVISVEHLTKQYNLGVIGTGTLPRDLERKWAQVRGKPDPYTRIGQKDAFESIGESILALDDVSFTVEQGEARASSQYWRWVKAHPGGRGDKFSRG